MGCERKPGRVPLPPELVRNNGVRVHLQAGQYADLIAIAEGWGVPPATAAYAMVAQFLADCRGHHVHLGPLGLRIAASSIILKAQGLDAAEDA